MTLHRAGPATSVQDLGRPGLVGVGLSRGGAMDPLALQEAAALLALPRPVAALEMVGRGACLSVDAPTRIALTGAPMTARLNTAEIGWNRSVALAPGDRLDIGGATRGVYGYVSCAGGFAQPHWQDSQAAHISAGIGGWLSDGTALKLGPNPHPAGPDQRLSPDDRFAGGPIRIMPGPQTALFDDYTLARFLATKFRMSARANRQGIALEHDGEPFRCAVADGLASDFIVAGDIQIAGAGHPYVLASECQTIGGYPRIGTVIPADLATLVQCQPGQTLTFDMLSVDEADALARAQPDAVAGLRARVQPLVRDPHDIPDLLSYQLIDGVTAGLDPEGTEP
ncbi:biotin-dependent carboxyltransferase family protein [Aliiroseovarius sp. PTFE2010]|uniref:5-oxoprolinase subunit C family protein n=1 Tax=Aliiroseovarius sp. PTFE2010 TaxID=3417190 RepID=UPI003CE814A2